MSESAVFLCSNSSIIRERERGKMAVSAVDFLLRKLHFLQIYPSPLIGEAKNHCQMLENNLRLFRDFLKDATTRGLTQNESVGDLIRQLKDVVRQAAKSDFMMPFVGAFEREADKLLSGIAKDIDSVGLKGRDIYSDEVEEVRVLFVGRDIYSDEVKEKTATMILEERQQKISGGLVNVGEEIIGHLRELAQELDIISIIGVPGSGKTTLAKKVFHDPRIVSNFRTRIWVFISHDFTQKNAFHAILREFTDITEDIHGKSNEELAQEIAFYLGSRGRFLIVMDNVRAAEDWDELKIAFPKSNKMGKVLITSRHMDVALNASPNRFYTSEERKLQRWSGVFRKGAKQQNIVVGMEDEAEQIINYLKQEAHELDIISIIGVPGIGKTTLAAKVFHDPTIVFEFRTRIWVCVSQDFTQKNVFLAILREVTSTAGDMHRKSNKELACEIASYLGSKGRFLIVLDDVWTTEDWDDFKIAFPKSNNMGKVLITSRHMEVARNANPNRCPHWLRYLDADESWMLFQWVVFGTHECPPELEDLGRVISLQCQGLALAIVVIGGILTTAYSTSNERNIRKNKWRKLSQNLDACVNEHEWIRMENLI